METKDVILQLRNREKLSQEELAEMVFVTRQAASRRENGESLSARKRSSAESADGMIMKKNRMASAIRFFLAIPFPPGKARLSFSFSQRPQSRKPVPELQTVYKET